MKPRAVIVVLAAVLVPAASEAASKLEMEHRNLMGSRPLVERSTILAGDGSLRIDRYEPAASEPRSTLIYRGDLETLFVVDHAEREVARLDRETMREMTRQMDDLGRQLEEELRKMPPEQRAMAEAMMRQRGVGPGAPTAGPGPELEATSETDTVAGYPCREYRLQEGSAVRVFCVAEWERLGLGEDVARAFDGLGELSRELVESVAESFPMTRLFGQRTGATAEPAGFPVASRKIRAGKTIHEEVLTGVSEVSAGPDDFRPPAGYHETAMKPPQTRPD